MEKIVRHESLFGKLTKVLDASHMVSEKSTSSELKIFKINDVMDKDAYFIGFGKPNLYLGYPSEIGFDKFDAKSLKRADSKVADTRGWAQSGLIFNLRGLPDDAKKRIRNSATLSEGTRSWTCVNANCTVLMRSGFTSGGKDLSAFYFPMPLARHILKFGLEYNGEKVEVEVIKTVPNYLESFGLSVIKSQWTTFCRHSERYLKSNSKTKSMLKNISKLKIKAKFIFNKKIKDKSDNKIEEYITMFPEDIECEEKLTLLISNPSRFGMLLRFIWGPHVLFQVKQSQESNKIDEYLPEKLKEYNKKSPNLFTRIKKNIIFSKPVIKFMRRHLIKSQEVVQNNSEKELFNMIRTNTEKTPHKYNIVITGDLITVIKLEIKYGFVDWVLSKHVLSSGYSGDVRYAGEFWKDKDGFILFNNDSGTYMPTAEQMFRAEKFLKQVFPNAKIVAYKNVNSSD
jgi:hypothetical protein